MGLENKVTGRTLKPPVFEIAGETFNSVWKEFYKTNDVKVIGNSIYVDFNDTIEFSSKNTEGYAKDFAEYIRQYPFNLLNAARSALSENLIKEHKLSKEKIEVRIGGVPETLKPGRISSSYQGQLIAFSGMVYKSSNPISQLSLGTFMCNRCSTETVKRQTGSSLEEPIECDKDAGGCGSSSYRTKFKLINERSIFEDVQLLNVINPKTRKGVWCKLRGEDLINTADIGDYVKITGSPNLSPYSRGKAKSIAFGTTVQVNCLEQKLSQKPKKCKKEGIQLVPGLEGIDHIKEALTLQLFGGVKDKYSRSDIHILLIGKPGVGKTTLEREIIQYLPIASYATFKTASIDVVLGKIEIESGRTILKAGEFSLNNHGLLALDDLEYIKKSELERLNEPLEDQQITLRGSGLSKIMPAYCSVLASGLATGKYPESFRDRFDLIFDVKTKANPDYQQINYDIKPAQAYITYGRSLNPTLDKKSKQIIDEYVRTTGWREGNKLKRLAEASAKRNLKTTVKSTDVNIAKKLIENCKKEWN